MLSVVAVKTVKGGHATHSKQRLVRGPDLLQAWGTEWKSQSSGLSVLLALKESRARGYPKGIAALASLNFSGLPPLSGWC